MDSSNEFRNVAVIGGGYVGLPTAAVLASFGHNVVLAEYDDVRYRSLNEGHSPYFEEGLEALMNEGVTQGKLRFVVDSADAVKLAEFIFICVPTPQSDDGSTDTSFLMNAVASITPNLSFQAIVVIKSTVPVGTSDRVFEAIGRDDISIVSNPEFLSAGSAVAESLRPERIIIGAINSEIASRTAQLFEKTQSPVVITNNVTAETIKYAANAFLAVRLSFSNELARFCEIAEANVVDLLQGLGYDHRIGFTYLKPGPGWGGSCLPKDTASLLLMGRASGFNFPVLTSAVQTNREQLEHVVRTIRSKIDGCDEPIVGIWGLTFKAGTDDLRNSPSIDVVRKLLEFGVSVKAYDPTVNPANSAHALDRVEIVSDAYGAAKNASLVVLLTDWPEFRELDWDKVSDVMRVPRIYDTRNLLNRDALANSIDYSSIGTISIHE
jgi:UDPglucose 6-dehydrogenase